MIFEILSGVLVVIFFIMGFKRGFIYEFFCMFKYILTIFLMKLFYDKGEEIFKLGKNVPKNQLNEYFIIFIILYLIFSVILFFFRNFLKSIKVENLNEVLGGIIGIIKTTFIIFIMYIVVVAGSSQSKRLKEIRDKSRIISKMTGYVYIYSEGFPEFIQEAVDSYQELIREKELEENVLDVLEEKDRKSEEIKNLK